MSLQQKLQYATFWQRLTAFMLDVFIVAIPVFTAAMVLTTPLFFDIAAAEAAHNKEFELIYQYYSHGVYVFLASFAAVSIVLGIFTTSNWQATPGKRIVNIYIARKNGARVSFSDAFWRFFSLPLFLLMIQIFERRENFAILTQLKRANKTGIDLIELENHLNGPTAQITSLAIFTVIIIWFFKIFFSPEKAAMHDTLFNTRVFQGRK